MFEKTLKDIIEFFNKNDIDYALIGGFAVGIYGITRTTFDLDFILGYEYREKIKKFFSQRYKIVYETENVLQLLPEDKKYCGIDILYAKKELGKNIIQRAKGKKVFNGSMEIKVAELEDIIGLKIQALKNEPKRYIKERYDIEFIMESYGKKLEWERIKKYFEIFGMNDDFRELKERYGR